MKPTYEMVLPWPPSLNTYYRRAGHTIHLSQKGRAFKMAVIQQLKAVRLHREAIADRLKVRIELYPPNRRKFDIDNRIKPVLDALQNGGLIVDDEQVDDVGAKRKPIDQDKKGFCRVLIECL